MQYGRIDGLDRPVSRLVQGCMMLGDDREKDFALLDGVFAAGCNTFDHGHIYGRGKCERMFGEWLKARGLRDGVVILDKGVHPSRGQKRVNPKCIRDDVSESLERLGVASIDIYALHRDDPAVPVGPIVEALNDLKKEGKIGIFGGSNWTHKRIAEANAFAAERGLEPFRVSSPNFSLAVQFKSPWGEDCVSISGPANVEARQWYRERNMPVLAWSTLARGFFSGRYSRENYQRLKGTPDESSIHAYCYEQNFARLDRAKDMASRRGLTVAQVALAWVLGEPLNLFALVGCYTPKEFGDCLAAAGVRLTDGERAWLDLRADAPQ